MRCSSRCASSSRPCAVQLVEPDLQLLLDRLDRLQQRRARRHIVRVGVDLDEFEVLRLLAGQRIEFGDGLDLVAEEADAPGAVLVVGGEDLDRVAAHAEHAAGEVAERALVLQRDEVGDELALVDLVAELQREGHRGIGLDRADAVDARDRGDDDDVVALQHRARRGVAHAVDLLVDGGFLLDIGVGARDVGFRLVIVVVGDEILDRVVGEEALELAVELRRQRLVGREDQRRALGRLDHLGHGEGLARAGDAEQHLVALVRAHALDQLVDRLRLVALGLEFRDQPEPPPPSDFSGRGGRCGVHGGRSRMLGSPSSSRVFSDSSVAGRAGQAARVALRRGALEARLRRFAEALRLLLDQGRIEQRREVLVERMDLRPRGFAMRGAAGLFGCGHGRNMGRRGAGEGRGVEASAVPAHSVQSENCPPGQRGLAPPLLCATLGLVFNPRGEAKLVDCSAHMLRDRLLLCLPLDTLGRLVSEISRCFVAGGSSAKSACAATVRCSG